ncbi:hypothetical protein KP509_30G058100 [Ceratopteris richardii]|uniref:Stress-response A/B barrel domain-containing protein n=1 Tax=Ceratopteris richardii TaxID=49495 RepID=A0A8T2R4Y7_CERRI|nr:hypothetical protein KP509_30G058100 [Ceratopteris richardii]KAH7290655.1 hypothetical protein KP509_30G058100 [Ceratopteris richardii]KAH7290658.1 hypothetical protein KP509_30G058100 [Ceratopteris richardii]
MTAYTKSPRFTRVEAKEEPCCAKCDNKPKPCDEGKSSPAVEHVVLFNMPFLQGDQEARVLHALYDLQFRLDSVDALVVGRVLNKVENVTHVLFIRFQTIENLTHFYRSDALSTVLCLMAPHIHGEIVIDYVSSTGHLQTECKDPVSMSLTLLRKKRDVSPGEMDCALFSLKALAEGYCFVNDFTFGSNLFISGDKYYTNAFAAFAKSLCELDALLEDMNYAKLLHLKVLPLSCSTITVNVLAFKPIKSCL